MRLFAFQGTRYATPDAGAQAAPPYDQIDDRLRDELQRRSPRQFAHLIKPVAAAGKDPYHHAAALHRDWLATGVLTEDPAPSLYPYTIVLPDGSERLGLAGLVGFEPPDNGVIRPHEQTLDKPLADRLALLRATGVDLEPVLLVSEDGGALERLLREDLAGPPPATPLVEHHDHAGNRHLLYRVDAPARIAAYRKVLAAAPAAIADGHHRYQTGARHAADTGAAPGSAATAKLAVITSVTSPALTIDPIHRALRELPDLSRVDRQVRARRRWREEESASERRRGWDFAAAVAAAPQPALGVWIAGEAPEIWELDPSAAPAGTSKDSARLTVTLLQSSLYPAFRLAKDAATSGTVVYRSDPSRLWSEIEDGALAVGLFLPPMSPAEFAAAIAHGDMLPPKSTRFLPKVVSGLVWAAHSSRLA